MRTRDRRIDTETRPYEAEGLPFTLRVSRHRFRRVVQIGGELDIASRDRAHEACLAGRGKVVIVEMGAMTFMDCCGYGGLVAARQILKDAGGSLTLHHQTGQPAELLTMLASLENGN